MKRYIKDDWEYNSSNDVNALKELMDVNISHQDDAEVGIFWYDPASDDLFGVKSASVDDVDFYHSNLFDADVKTCRPLHYKVWEKEFYRGKDSRFKGDYTQVPRGRVFYVKDRGFVVITGSWINEFPQVKELVRYEFNLPSDTEFQIDSY